ncbi:MAG TPA: hypothetical protein VMD92_03745 [Acidobacteriaceae bacterium]|nr:hypothetical protein [Acidobacteriaceae bacterium]
MISANGRIDVIQPDHRVVLGESFRVELHLHAPGLTQIRVSQLQYANGDREQPDPVTGSDGVVPIAVDSNGIARIEITPMRLGNVEVRLSGRFPDDGVFYKSIMLTVVSPEHPPHELIVAQMGGPPENTKVIMLFMAPPGWRDALITYAVYDGIKVPLRIDSSYVSYRMITGDDTNPVRLDKATGLLTPLHTGEALIETSFAGRSNLTCVVVSGRASLDASAGDSCAKLLAPRQQLGPVE